MSNKIYWKGLEQLNPSEAFKKSVESEFPENAKVEELLGHENVGETSTNRRDFLKFLGFSTAAATLAACEAPVNRAIPYLNKPEDITPGVANYFATTFYDSNDYASILVKVREGRPIKIEGNKLSKVSNGTVNARINSSVLGLYDNSRAKAPEAAGRQISWSTLDAEVKAKLTEISARGGKIRVLTSSIISPSTKALLAQFKAKFPSTEVVTFDAVSYSGLITANQASFGKAVIPDYYFDKSKVIVSFGADFMNTWLNGNAFAKAYAATRNPKNKAMSRHFQFETALSLSGSNADVRVALKASQLSKAVVNLYNEIAKKAGAATLSSTGTEGDKAITKAANELWANKGASIVVAGSNDSNVQIIINAINALLGNYGSTIDLENPLNLRQGVDSQVLALLSEVKAGNVDALLINGCNPAYSLPGFAEALPKVGLSVYFGDRADETGSLTKYLAPSNHYLESWDDAEPKAGFYSLTQPTIAPLFKTRQMQDSLLAWADIAGDYHSFIKSYWLTNLHSKSTEGFGAEEFWVRALQNGVFETALVPAVAAVNVADINAAATAATKSSGGSMELVIYTKTGIGDGAQANNPWLQEFPDPISKYTWDNYVAMAVPDMKKLGLTTFEDGDNWEMADVVEVSVNGKSVKLPAIPQPGQKAGTVSIALGYGRTKAGKTADGVGANLFNFVSTANGYFDYQNLNVTVTKTGEQYPVAATQTHHTLMGRDMVKETLLAEYIKDPKSGNPDKLLQTTNHGKVPVTKVNLWDDHPIERGHRWGMTIDLNACIGCGSCVTSCSSENNVAVVGKDEVRRNREMHWIRIDRYYTSEMTEEKAEEKGVGAIDKFLAMEDASENPSVVFQPMLCQHCNHAPCETVCPVAATTHSNEGLNQMTYNRCIGTRYCANNCPYKVRRFNYFKYFDNDQFPFHFNDDLGKLVINPDVTVRSRGVMEKCSFCVQRIQSGKLRAKKEGRKINDGEIQTACQTACPTNAILFGDLNDAETEVAKYSKDERGYHMLEEVGIQPNIWYMTKVRNRSKEENENVKIFS
jgi:MoCo/4Fe-4S cofactor protein with predicted Tat translocation signal